MFILILLFTIIILFISIYWHFNVRRPRAKLNWLPTAPGYPIIGSALSLVDPTASLKRFSEYCTKHNGLFTFNILHHTFVAGYDNKYLEYIFTSHETNNKYLQYRYLKNWLGDGLLLSENKKWKSRRRILTPAFHFSILEQFIGTMNSVTDILIQKWERKVDNPCLDIYPDVTLCSLDIICEATMGVSVKAQMSEDSDYVKSVKELCRIVVERTFSFYKGFDFFYYFTEDYRIEQKCLKTVHSVSKSIIENRLKELKSKTENDDVCEGGKKKMAFLDLLLQAKLNGNELSLEDIREEVDTFMFEGHDTTSSAVSFTLYCLSRHPEHQNKIVEELKYIIGDDINRPISLKDLQQMKYLENCIKEALRLYPSVPFVGRAVEKDIFIDGKCIPKGTSAMIYIFGSNRNPEYFENPDIYIPDRFNEMTGKYPYSYIPFSAGSRNCIGQKFAMLELKTMIAKILLHYELVAPKPNIDVVLSAEAVLKSMTGVKCGLKQRIL